MGAGAYGVLLGAAWFVIDRFAPQPEGATLWFTFWGVQLARLSRVCWNRTGLPYAAAAMLLGSTMSVIIAVLAWEGHRMLNAEC